MSDPFRSAVLMARTRVTSRCPTGSALESRPDARERKGERTLTRSAGPHYTARPGSRVPMFTSRCTTPPACALAQPRQDFVGRSSAARFLVSGHLVASRNFESRIDVQPDRMTALAQLPLARPRHAGQRRPAASWRAPIGAMGAGVQPLVDAIRAQRGMRMGRQDGRKQKYEVTHNGANGFGFRSLDAGNSGAGSGYRGDAP